MSLLTTFSRKVIEMCPIFFISFLKSVRNLKTDDFKPTRTYGINDSYGPRGHVPQTILYKRIRRYESEQTPSGRSYGYGRGRNYAFNTRTGSSAFRNYYS